MLHNRLIHADIGYDDIVTLELEDRGEVVRKVFWIRSKHTDDDYDPNVIQMRLVVLTRKEHTDKEHNTFSWFVDMGEIIETHHARRGQLPTRKHLKHYYVLNVLDVQERFLHRGGPSRSRY